MAIIALKAWYLEKYEPIREVIQRSQDLRLSRNSLLKSGLRADFLDDSAKIESSAWFQRYLDGDKVEFYIEGSGGYAIANIDLISHEIYFTKQDVTATLDPIIYFSPQSEYIFASEAIRSVLNNTLETFNQLSRLPLTLEEANRPLNAPVRLSDSHLRKIRKSLLYIADGTAIARIQREDNPSAILNSMVCVELGYAVQCKRPGQILLVRMERDDLKGDFPLELPNHRQLSVKTVKELETTLPTMVETLLQRFAL
ncbi:MAG: hypothetical protein AB4058_16190 [Microcystaceae cyanobacterium]